MLLIVLAGVLNGTLQDSVQELAEEVEMLCDGLDIGDLVQIRGTLKCYEGVNYVAAKYFSEGHFGLITKVHHYVGNGLNSLLVNFESVINNCILMFCLFA